MNDDHLRILRQGVEAWNKWRAENPEIVPDLAGANLSGASLSGANLGGADLGGADLGGADLSDANLTGANLIWTSLSSANLSRAHLSGANVGRANLTKANLEVAYLIRAVVVGATLSGANLSGADLSGANLNVSYLGDANLSDAKLNGATLSNATIGGTIFADVDLSEVKGLETVRHRGPSTIGIDTLYKSGGKIDEFFLRGCGVPDEFISYIPSHIGARQAIQFYSCFISHGVKDKSFCERLYADLQAKNVRVWYFPEDAKWGEPVWGEIDKSIKIYDKLVVVYSRNSLQSGPVLREIQRALSREDYEGRNVLFPVRIDDYIFKTWEHERKADVLSKVVGNFTGWHRSAAKYEEAFEKLLRALQAVDGKV